ncbi:hypothetical protein CALCODRAFT_191653 [Calocera cornea HHB12733]|uniref:Restriction of telomere capping protein 4 n=1 Tax=Calocera cornea HHB12733 TaxID=1353952 RepID=A0A165HMI2_9BASI|nr:hypothetical protein CALCODRAFT_191653 [Calocera cornea HHB12733]
MERMRQKMALMTSLRKPNEWNCDAGGMGDELRTTQSRPLSATGKGKGPRVATSSSSQLRDSTFKNANILLDKPLEEESSEDPINMFSSSPNRSPERLASSTSAPIKRQQAPKSNTSTKPMTSSAGVGKKAQPKPRATTALKSRHRSVSDENEPVQGPSSSLSSSTSAATRPFPMALTNTKAPIESKKKKDFPMVLVKKTKPGLNPPAGKATPAGPMEPRTTRSKSTAKQLPMPFPMELTTDSSLPDAGAAVMPVTQPTASAFPMQLPSRAATTVNSIPPNIKSVVTELSKKDDLGNALTAAPKPFPMNLTLQKPAPAEARGKKRESPKSKAQADRERTAKKSRLEDGKSKPAVDEDDEGMPTGSLGRSMHLNSSQSSSSSGPESGQRQLCPFCDEPWPERPSKRLTALLDQVKLHAWKDPRYSNPDGFSAPMEVFVTLCTLHRSESSHIPEGIAEGWPTKIDFGGIPARLGQKKHALKKIVDDPSLSPFFQAAKNDILEKGARVAASAFGQYETFERCQPGYYGERGMVVIQHALDSMFADVTMSCCEPLSVDDFIRQTLVPEAALLLIGEDLRLSRADALAVLLKSRKYGVAQFPDRDVGDTQWQDVSMSPIHERTSPPISKVLPQHSASSPLGVTNTSKPNKRMIKPSNTDWTYNMKSDAGLSSELGDEPVVASVAKHVEVMPRSAGYKGRNQDSWLLSSSDAEDAESDEE